MYVRWFEVEMKYAGLVRFAEKYFLRRQNPKKPNYSNLSKKGCY